MMYPLYVLAFGAVIAGTVFYYSFVGKGEGAWWNGAIFNGPENHVLHDAHSVPSWVKLSPFLAMLIGLGLAWLMYIRSPEIPRKLAERHQPLYQFLLNKWYFDEFYSFLFVRPAMWVGSFFWKKGDGSTIDGFLNGLAMGIVPWMTRLAGRFQSGFLFHYAFVMLVGVSAIVTWFAVGGGAR